MNAWVLHGVKDLRFEESARPVPGSGEVVVAVKAAGICGSDIPRIYQTGTYRFPLIPGHEFSGTVVELGPGTRPYWLGKRTGVFPLIPCGTCSPCQKGQYELCRHYSYLGSRRDGGFAEYAAVPEDSLIELPEKVSFEEAAMLEPMAVAVHAMRRLAPKPEEAVAICGLGTIGLLLAMFLWEAGIRKLFLIGNKDIQRQSAVKLDLPAECFCSSAEQDPDKWLLERTEGLGADVVFECVGKAETLAQVLAFAAPGGRICLVGNPYADMCLPRAVYWKILRNQLTVTGTWNSSFRHEAGDDWNYVLDRLAQRRISPAKLISHRFPLRELDRGFHIMQNKSEDYVKVMGAPHGGPV